MRISGRLLALSAVLAALAWPSADAARPLDLAGTARTAKQLVGLVGNSENARLARLDETTLKAVRPLGPRLGSVDAWAFSPDGRRLAIATHPRGAGIFRDTIRLVNLQTLRVVRKSVALNGMARALLWAGADRIVALVAGDADWSALVSVDVAARRVARSKVLEGNVTAIARTPDSLVLLATPANAIGAPNLVLVDASGSAQSVTLSHIRGGMVWPQDSTGAMIGTQRLPALAVDAEGGRAYVVAPDGAAVDVDLRTLAVSYHDLAAPRSVLERLSAWLQPSAQAKGLNGPARQARWLGDGLIALTGTDETASTAGGGLAITSSPAGLAIVDTHDWTVRMLDPGADTVTAAAGVLLATGRTWSSTSQETHGMGLAVYGRDRALRVRLWPGTSAWVDAVWAGRAYVQVTSGGTAKFFVVDLATGTVVGQRSSALPVPLLGDGPDL
jgi:hypothetical protein